MIGKLVPVILAGGQGTRLWPMSRSARPKQFLPLTGPASLFQQTLQRVADPQLYTAPIVTTHADYRFIVAEQAAEHGIALAGILLEPLARNTALAIAAAALHAQASYGEGVLLHILPSDHEVIPDEGYWLAIANATSAAADGALVTFGVRPTQPETGFGYIKSAARVGQGADRVERFVEKPNATDAAAMLAEGGYSWNSGMFLMRADAFLDECRRLAPDTMLAAHSALDAARVDLDFVRLDHAAFVAAPDISVDKAVFEHTDISAVVAVDFAWSDMGSWDAVWKAGYRDSLGNVTQGAVTLDGVTGSLVMTDHAHVAVNGVADLAVIVTNDVVYVGRLSEAQKVGKMVERLRSDAKTARLTETHRTAHRPWGGYTSVSDGERFQIKRLFVRPGKQLSLQRHLHRAEHWIVVRGTAQVTLDDTISTLTENQAIYLPVGCVHRLANPGKIDLELVEVQTGSYLGEDDIIRIEDSFGRT